MTRCWRSAALLCALSLAGCSSGRDGFAPTAPLRHVALEFNAGQWSEEKIETPRRPKSQRMATITHREYNTIIGVIERESFKPWRLQSSAARHMHDELRRQFSSVAPADQGLPQHALVLPVDWTCGHHVVTPTPSDDAIGYTSCVHSTPIWFAVLVVLTPTDASEGKIAATNAVLATIRTD